MSDPQSAKLINKACTQCGPCYFRTKETTVLRCGVLSVGGNAGRLARWIYHLSLVTVSGCQLDGYYKSLLGSEFHNRDVLLFPAFEVVSGAD